MIPKKQLEILNQISNLDGTKVMQLVRNYGYKLSNDVLKGFRIQSIDLNRDKIHICLFCVLVNDGGDANYLSTHICIDYYYTNKIVAEFTGCIVDEFDLIPYTDLIR